MVAFEKYSDFHERFFKVERFLKTISAPWSAQGKVSTQNLLNIKFQLEHITLKHQIAPWIMHFITKFSISSYIRI